MECPKCKSRVLVTPTETEQHIVCPECTTKFRVDVSLVEVSDAPEIEEHKPQKCIVCGHLFCAECEGEEDAHLFRGVCPVCVESEGKLIGTKGERQHEGFEEGSTE